MRWVALLLAAWPSWADNGPFMPRRSTQAPHCPQGFRVLETPGPLKFRCVAERLGSADRVLKGPEAPAAQPPVDAPASYEPLRVPGLRVDVPRGWARTDAWKDDPPTLFLEEGERRRGKPVSMTVTRFSPGRPDYESLEDALSKELEYQGARETARRRVGGLPARQTLVPKESRTAYVDAGAGVYFVFTYSAPDALFKSYEAAFDRLLSSARFK